jgi:hypothetical protein
VIGERPKMDIPRNNDQCPTDKEIYAKIDELMTKNG